MKYGLTWKETDQITLRGLEDFFGMRSKEEIRHEHVAKVLKEQTRQRLLLQTQGATTSTGVRSSSRSIMIDVDTLRYVSSESSAEGRQRAAVVGRDDAIVAQRCYYNNGPCDEFNTTTTSTNNYNSSNNNNKNNLTTQQYHHHHPSSSSCHVTCLASWEQQWFY
jgi:hypothetical protein